MKFSASRPAFFGLCVALFCLGSGASLEAATFTVNTAEDQFDTPSGTQVSLREALRDAAAAAGSDTIEFDQALAGATLAARGEWVVSDPSPLLITGENLKPGLTLSGERQRRILSVEAGARLTLAGLTLTDGANEGNGGAILNLGDLTLRRCALTNCFANHGGAVHNQAELILEHCTLAGNSARNQGGALRNLNGKTRLTHCTVTDNSAGQGGGIFTAGPVGLTLENSISAENTGGTGGDVYAEGLVISAGANLVSSSAGSPVVGPAFITANPLLAPLASNGGPTQTRRVLHGSPARNAAVGSSALFDQRGFPMVQTPDIGACENQLGVLADLILSQNTTTSPISFAAGNIGVLTGSSSNPILLPSKDIVFGGFSPSPTVTITLSPGWGIIVIIITDPNSGDVTHFSIQVNNPPVASGLPDTTILENTSSELLGFDVADLETAPVSLIVTADSDNQTLLPKANILLGGAAGARTIKVTPALKQVGTTNIAVTVSDGMLSALVTFKLTVLADTPLNQWKVQQFGANAFNPEISGDLADADKDGVSNLIEFALRTSPVASTPSAFGLAAEVILPGGQAGRRFSFPCRPGTAGLTYRLQRCTNLADWTDVWVYQTTTQQVTQAEGISGSVNELDETATVDVSQPSYFEGKNFWRLAVDQP